MSEGSEKPNYPNGKHSKLFFAQASPSKSRLDWVYRRTYARLWRLSFLPLYTVQLSTCVHLWPVATGPTPPTVASPHRAPARQGAFHQRPRRQFRHQSRARLPNSFPTWPSSTEAPDNSWISPLDKTRQGWFWEPFFHRATSLKIMILPGVIQSVCALTL